VKLLLDENLSDRIISRVVDLFPDSTHIKAVGLREAEDFVVWEWAKKHGFTIGYCVWPPAEDHLATRRELRD
jgi:predicted nuclease of predicted toxin-antitoxin system